VEPHRSRVADAVALELHGMGRGSYRNRGIDPSPEDGCPHHLTMRLDETDTRRARVGDLRVV